MTAGTSLTAELRSEVLRLEDDLRQRLTADSDLESAWRREYADALAVERTAASWEAWSAERITLAAVGWVLTTVLIRFCEANGLLKKVWISGPGARHQEAVEAQQEFIRVQARTHGDVTDREWLLQAVDYLRENDATRGLVDPHNPMWLVRPSGDAVTRLLSFWRERDEQGGLIRDLADATLSTRFLGDLYQDISDDAKKRYALLQTPEFVEEFILDRTMEPALAERPLEGFRMIDPTCGSGHFLLGAFARLLDRWHKHDPGLDERERVQRALDAVHGVDVNPFAVEIARFRLTVAALQAAGIGQLEKAPAFRYHLAAGDSLLHGLDQYEIDAESFEGVEGFAYATEDLVALREILQNGRYDVVVGNPPYITVKDKALNAMYRRLYSTAHRQYALTVPFMERFFSLAKSGSIPGWVGQITSNSFMKREFGAPLIERFLPTKDLRLVVDTSGAYIPGHGTPTLIIVGRNAQPVSGTIRTVLGVRGEPGQPTDPAKGKVWSSIVAQIHKPGWDGEWVTVADLQRSQLARHPWSLAGAGAVELLQFLAGPPLRSVVRLFGYTGQTNADDVFLAPANAFRRRRVERDVHRPLVTGELVRDFEIHRGLDSLFLYADNQLMDIKEKPGAYRWMWPTRTSTWSRSTFGKRSYREEGRTWWEWHQVALNRLVDPLSIAFAFVATHNHFVLDRGGKVFNRSAPVIKLPEGATEDEHLALLGVLNSSTACFWLKQNSHDKGNGGYGGGIADQEWERFYEFTGTTLQDFPLPSNLPLERGRLLDRLAQRLASVSPAAISGAAVPTRDALNDARREYESLRRQMVAVQEELDWETYRLYGLVDDDLTYQGDDLPEVALGERAFEIVLARRVAQGLEETAWFERHGSKPVTEIPPAWPASYRALVERRIELITSHPYLKLLEKPENKRRWAAEPWEKQEHKALHDWLLDRLEDRRFWFDRQGRPRPRSVAGLADDVARDGDVVEVLQLWEGRRDVPVSQMLERLLADEFVPYLAAMRYKQAGLQKRKAWERTWDLQRREDAGTYNPAPQNVGGDGSIPVPPKYATADFVKVSYWRHRGKLDVPKERFIGYPEAGRDTDPTMVLGWAGWDHVQQALAIAILLQDRDADGWPDNKLVPLVAGLQELLPWVKQWHSEPDPAYGGISPADFIGQQLEEWTRRIHTTPGELRDWRPSPLRRGRTKKSTP